MKLCGLNGYAESGCPFDADIPVDIADALDWIIDQSVCSIELGVERRSRDGAVIGGSSRTGSLVHLSDHEWNTGRYELAGGLDRGRNSAEFHDLKVRP